jgi:hypothetical protein
MLFGEVNEGPDVEIADGLGDRIDVVRGKGGEPTPDSIDYAGPAVRLDALYSARVGVVQAEYGDLEIGGMRNGSAIERVLLRNGAELDVASGSVLDSDIGTIENVEGTSSAFNEATLTDDGGTGAVRFNFDTQFNEPPTLSFGRRGGGIEGVSLRKTSADGQFYAADIEIADPGGTVDVKVEMRGVV